MSDNKPSDDKSWSKDDEIAHRLMKLKQEDEKRIEQRHIEERLAKLKGIDPSVYSAPPITVYQMVKSKKTDHEKTDDLMSQFMEEVNIDKKSNFKRRSSTDKEIEERLERLKKERGGGGHGLMSEEDKNKQMHIIMDVDSESDIDEETQQADIIARLLAESKLPSIPDGSDNSLKKAHSEEENVEIGSDELPWCNICNEDAIVRCLNCNGDLYCRSCFKDFHDDQDLKRHKTAPFKKPKRTSYH